MLKLNGKVIEIKKYPDGTPLFDKIDHTPYRYSCGHLNRGQSYDFLWLYENNEELIYLSFLVQHCKENAQHGAQFNLVMPYIPNARMDRTKSAEEVFTLKYFCNIINSMEFDNVEVFDPHSNVSTALINKVYQSPYVASTIYKAIKKYNPDVLFFPDEGSCKRYSEMLKNFYGGMKKFYGGMNISMPAIAYANKNRDWATGKILGLSVQNGEVVNGKNVLIIDDICSKGTTFVYSAKALKELGAKEINLYISHCENTILEGDIFNSGLINEVYTTNSIFTKNHENIFVDNIF